MKIKGKATKNHNLFLIKLIKRIMVFVLGLALFSLLNQSLIAWGQSPNLSQWGLPSSGFAITTEGNEKSIEAGKVRLDGRALFRVAVPNIAKNMENADPSPLQERIRTIQDTLNRIANSPFDPQSLQVTSQIDTSSNLPVIFINDQYLMTVTTLDAQLYGYEPQRQANRLTQIIKDALLRAQLERQPQIITRQSLIAVGILLALLGSSWGITRLQQRLKWKKRQLTAQITPDSQIAAQSAHQTQTVTKDNLEHQRNKQQHRDITDLQNRLLQLLQVGIWVGGILLILGLYPYTRWLQPFLLSTPLKILSIGLGIYAAIRLSDVLVERLAQALIKGNLLKARTFERSSLRVSTFSRVLKSGAAVIWLSLGILAILSIIGVDVIPLLAGAGLIGLAISFAAQSLVKDMINGFFILLEDQYAVGDVISVDDVSGLVENMNLRITQLRNNEGQLITIPNSAITVVRNLSKDWSRVDLTINLAYGTDPNRALSAIQAIAQEMEQDPKWQEKILEPPEVLGIDQIDHTGLLIRVWIKTLPLQQWIVAREFRRRLALALEQEGLAIGVPQQSLRLRNSFDLDIEKLDNN
jgi:small-conductance mechanosensitive channel